MHTLYIVVPCYNEEEVLPETSRRLRDKMRQLIETEAIAPDSRIMLVNDGSKDRTWEMISALHRADPLFDGLCLSRNRGHQNALLAGLLSARHYADMVISMDADLQDDINAVDEMISHFEDGCDIVYGVRSARNTDTAFKRGTAQRFYKFINALGGELVYDHADYRLMSRRALDALAEYGEVNLFLRGIVPMLGYKTATVEYARGKRFAGESKYSLKKMCNFAGDGITSLTTQPLRAILLLGLVTLAISLVLLVVFLVQGIATWGADNWQLLSGIRVCIFLLVFFSGLILSALGVVGEYVGKTYLESKHRPRYHIAAQLHHDATAPENTVRES